MEPTPFLRLLGWPTNPNQAASVAQVGSPALASLRGLSPPRPPPGPSFGPALPAVPDELQHTHHGHFWAGVSHMEEQGHCSLESQDLEALMKLLATIVDDIPKQEDGAFPHLCSFLGEMEFSDT